MFEFKETYDFTAAEPFKLFIIEQDPGKSGSAFKQVVLFVEGKGLEYFNVLSAWPEPVL